MAKLHEVIRNMQLELGTWKPESRGIGGHSSIMMGAWYGCQSGTGKRKRTRMKRMTCQSQAASGAHPIQLKTESAATACRRCSIGHLDCPEFILIS